MKKILMLAMAATLALVLVACGEAYANANENDSEIAQNEEMIELSPVFVDDINVAGARVLRDEDYFPTHVELVPVAQALGASVSWDEETGEVRIAPVRLIEYDIEFIAGEEHYSIIIEDVLYLPITFFRNELGVFNVSIQSGEVHMHTHAVEDGNF